MTGLKTRIETPYIKESINFYVKHIGMRVLESWGDNGAILGFSPPVKGEAFLELAYAETLWKYEGMNLQFRVNSLADIVEKLQGKVDFRGPVKRPWGSKYIYLEDPTGIMIIIYEGKL